MSSAFSVQTRKMQYFHYNSIITSNYILLSQVKNSQEIDNIKVDFAILIFLVSNYFILSLQVEFEDIKGVIRIRISKKYRQHIGQKIPKGGNQNPYIEEIQTTHWAKEKGQKEEQ